MGEGGSSSSHPLYKATGRQTVRVCFQTGVETLAARNEGLKLFAPRLGGAASEEEQSAGAGRAREAEKDKEGEQAGVEEGEE